MHSCFDVISSIIAGFFFLLLFLPYNRHFYYRNRRDHHQNGDAAYDSRDNWNRGGNRYPSDRERDLPRNDRWQEPEKPRENNRWDDGGNGGGGGGGGGGGRRENNSRWNDGREQRRNDNDWTVLLPKDERLEQELYGTGNTGINFSKYEDIPVEATGDKVPCHITSVSAFKNDYNITGLLFFFFINQKTLANLL